MNCFPVVRATLFVLCLGVLLINAYGGEPGVDYEPGQLEVKFQPGVLPISISIDTTSGVVVTNLGWLNTISVQYHLTLMKRVTIKPINPDLDAWYHLEFDPEADVPLLQSLFEAQSDVVYAEPNSIAIDAQPNDINLGQQWYHNVIHSTEVWDDGNGEVGMPSVIIAILDRGVDYMHPDLINRVFRNTDELEITPGARYWTGNQLAGNAVDDDNNGYLDDYYGWDFRPNHNGQQTPNGDNNAFPFYLAREDPRQTYWTHGTKVTGVAVEQTNNLIGGAGIAGGWGEENNGCRFLPCICNDADQYATAIHYAVNMAAQHQCKLVITISRSLNDSRQLSDNIRWATTLQTDAPTIIVAAAGNLGVDNVSFPASDPHVLGIAGTTQTDRMWPPSQRGSLISLCAPADNIYTTTTRIFDGQNDAYVTTEGTSLASPIVAGAAALLWSSPTWSTLTNTGICSRLRGTASHIDEVDPINAMKTGGGRLDIQAAMLDNEHPNLLVSQIAVETTSGDSLIYNGETVSLFVYLKNFWVMAWNVSATLVSDDPDLIPLAAQTTTTFLDLDEGTEQIAARALSFDVSQEATAGLHTMSLHVTANNGDYTETIKIPITVFRSPIEPCFTTPVYGRIIWQMMSDLNQDGNKQLIFGSKYHADNHSIYVVESNGMVSTADLPQGWELRVRPAIGDINGDGRQEIVAVAKRGFNTPAQILLYVWTSDLTQAYDPIIYSGMITTPVDISPVLADLNGDGLLDIVVTTSTQDAAGPTKLYAYSVVNNLLSPLADWTSNPVVISEQSFVSPSVADIDGDFRPEIVLGSGRYAYFYNGQDGFESRQRREVDPNQIFICPPVIGDFDGDNTMDVVFESRSIGINTDESLVITNIYDYSMDAFCPDSITNEYPVGSISTPHVIAADYYDPGTSPLDIIVPYKAPNDSNNVINMINGQSVVVSGIQMTNSMHCIAADISGDGIAELVACGATPLENNPQPLLYRNFGTVMAFDQLGSVYSDWDYNCMSPRPFQAALLADDWNGDNLVDIIVISSIDREEADYVNVYSLPTSASCDPENILWSQENHDLRNTNCFAQVVTGTMGIGNHSLSGKVIVDGTVTVPAGATLSILPGTVVEMRPDADLIVDGGSLIAEGTINDSIYIKAEGANPWHAIYLTGADHVSLQRCVIHGGKYVDVYMGGEITINECRIHDMNYGIRIEACGEDVFTCTDNTVENCAYDGICGTLSSGLFERNIITNCGRAGIYWYGDLAVGSPPVFRYNHINGNGTATTGAIAGGYFCNTTAVLKCNIFQYNHKNQLLCELNGNVNMNGNGDTLVRGTNILHDISTELWCGSCDRCCYCSTPPATFAPLMHIVNSIPQLINGNNTFKFDIDGTYLYDMKCRQTCLAPFPPPFLPNDINGNSFIPSHASPGTGNLHFCLPDRFKGRNLDSVAHECQGMPQLPELEPHVVLYQQAAISETNGNFAQARAGYQNVINQYPESNEAQWAARGFLRTGLENNDSPLSLHDSLTAIAIESAPTLSLRNTSRRESVWALIAGNYFDQANTELQAILADTLSEDSLWALVTLEVVSLLESESGSGKTGVTSDPRSIQRRVSAFHDRLHQLMGRPTDTEIQNSNGAAVPVTHLLSSAFPNPFNSRVTIQFALPEASRVKLEVFNILGQKVATLANETLKAGNHSYHWSAESVSSGVYIYRIEAERDVESKKLLLLR